MLPHRFVCRCWTCAHNESDMADKVTWVFHIKCTSGSNCVKEIIMVIERMIHGGSQICTNDVNAASTWVLSCRIILKNRFNYSELQIPFSRGAIRFRRLIAGLMLLMNFSFDCKCEDDKTREQQTTAMKTGDDPFNFVIRWHTVVTIRLFKFSFSSFLIADIFVVVFLTLECVWKTTDSNLLQNDFFFANRLSNGKLAHSHTYKWFISFSTLLHTLLNMIYEYF